MEQSGQVNCDSHFGRGASETLDKPSRKLRRNREDRVIGGETPRDPMERKV